MRTLSSPPSETNISIIRAKMPMSPHRFHLAQCVLGGPYSRGASHHLKPLLLMKIIPLGTRRAAMRLALAHREEVLQPLHLRFRQPVKIAHHHPLHFGVLNHADQT